MTSLTQAAITTRKIIRYGTFGIIAFIIGRIIVGAGITIYRKVFPPPPPKPTVSFGKLPKLPFAEKPLPANLTFGLETATGALPKLATQTKVYFMPKLSANLLSLPAAQDKAESLNFNREAQEISQTIYRFTHKNSPAILEMNIISGAFSISYDLKADSTPLNFKPPVPEIAAAQVRSYLSSADLLPADLSGPTGHEFLKLNEGKLTSAISLSESDFIQINLFRKNYDNLPVLTPDPNRANVWFLVSGITDRDRQIVAAEYHYFPIDENQFSTYPVKSSETAWNEFAAGQFKLADIGTNQEGDSIKIRKIYLAYFDPGTQFDFLEPIFVFEGDRGFLAYLPAVTADYYGE